MSPTLSFFMSAPSLYARYLQYRETSLVQHAWALPAITVSNVLIVRLIA